MKIITNQENSSGGSKGYKTGDWRSIRAVINKDECINCLSCWLYCPNVCIVLNKERNEVIGIDLDYCKGCGVCADVCPKKCISLKNENEYEDKQTVIKNGKKVNTSFKWR